MGVALASLGRIEESDSHFEEAIALFPDGVSAYFYWARSLLKQGRGEEAKALIASATRNAKKIVNYAELAGLYFWLPNEPNGVLERRAKYLPRVFGVLDKPASSSQ